MPPQRGRTACRKYFSGVNDENRDEFIKVLEKREDSLTSAQLARIKKLYKKLGVKQ